MQSPTNTMFANIVVPIDLSDKQNFKLVLEYAMSFVQSHNSKLHFIHVMPDFGMKVLEDYLPRNFTQKQRAKNKQQLEEIIKKYIPENVEIETIIGRGAVYDEVINYSEKINADLIMLSAVRPQFKDYMLGPNASKIVRHSSISVMVVRD